MDTQTQIDRLIELAIIQRSELKQLVEQLPQLREHLNAEVEKVFEETEPQLRAELEDWTTKQTSDKAAALGAALEAKITDLAKSLEISTQARYNAIIAEREENTRLAAQAEQKIAEHAASLPSAVKDIVTAELARFPRAGEIDQLRKEFAEPKSLNPRGKWQAGETYNKLDLVTINGDSYTSAIDGNKTRPTRSSADWTLVAARGTGGGGGPTSLTDLTAVPQNGELLIGNGSAFVNNTLTAGTGVTITNGAGTITIDASGAQELLTATVKNADSVAITKGQVVYLFGATGGFPSVKLANNTSDATSNKTFGVVSDTSIAPNGTGTVTCVGVVDGLNLGAYNDGDAVYLGATAGAFTATKPYAPNHLVFVGIIERANPGNGELYVRIQNGYELEELHNVQITTPPLAGSLLMYDATNSLWKANRLTAGTNIAVTNADTSVTLGLTGTVAVANGGTGVTTSTGTGSVVLSNTPTLVTPNIGAATGTSVNLSGAGTFGGNLTVSGTGTNLFGGGSRDAFVIESDTAGNGAFASAKNAAANDYEPLFLIGETITLKYRSGVNSSTAGLTLTSTGTTLAGNLTVSGTGNNIFNSGGGNVGIGTSTISSRLTVRGPSGAPTLTAATAAILSLLPGVVGTNLVVGGDPSYPFAIWLQNRHETLNGSSYPIALNPLGGNLLIGTTTDSGAKLQIGTNTTTSAGGAVFGTDAFLYRSTSGYLTLESGLAGQVGLQIKTAGSLLGSFAANATDLYIDARLTGGGIYFRTNGATTALTLDSSQRTIANGVFWSSSTGNTSTNGFNNATSVANNLISLYASTGSANIQIAGRVTTFDGGSGYYGLNLQVPTSAYPDFSGTVNWTNALTLTSQNATFAGAKITLGGSGNGEVEIRRASNSNGSSVLYSTSSTLKWFHGLRALANDNWYLQNEVAGNTALFFDAATSNATFAGAVTTFAGAVTTKGSTLSAINNTNVSTTATDIAIATSVGGLYFVTGYNTSGGAQGTWLLMARGTNVTTISSDNNTGLTVTYSISSGKLQAATASGTIALIATAITR